MYVWIKAFHIIAIICWFAGFFYLPRLFVYHAQSNDQISIDRFKIMERKLYRGIMTPSAIIATLLGSYMLAMNPTYYFNAGWMHIKLGCVLLLAIHHLMCGHYLKQFTIDNNQHSHVYYRWFNEVPAILVIAVVVLVEVKPF